MLLHLLTMQLYLPTMLLDLLTDYATVFTMLLDLPTMLLDLLTPMSSMLLKSHSLSAWMQLHK